MLFNSFGNDITNTRVGSTILLQHVLTQCNIIRKMRLWPSDMLHLQEFLQRIFITSFLQTTVAAEHGLNNFTASPSARK